MPTLTNEQILSSFCARSDDSREHLHRPFVINERVWASNGRIAVCVESELAEGYSTGKINSSFFERIKGQSEKGGFFDLSEFNRPNKRKCSVCKGTGKCQVIACIECEGIGKVNFSNNWNEYSIDCKGCKGQGTKNELNTDIDCYECNGKGRKYTSFAIVQVKDTAFKLDAESMELIEKLSKVTIKLDNKEHLLFFKFSRGFGCAKGI